MTELPLADVLKKLRSELLEAQKDSVGQPLALVLGDVEIELKLAVAADAKGDFGLRLGVVSVGGGGGGRTENLQTLRLKLKPTGPGGKEFAVSDLGKL